MSTTQPQPQVWIADDGELADVREAFLAIGADVADGAEVAPAVEIPLLVTSTAYAGAALQGDAMALPRHQIHLVVSDANAEGAEKIPCDFLLRRPVNREVLRLLIERACYEGPERRRMTRVALGSPVTLRNGRWDQQAILAQISVGGCGLVTGFPLEIGRPIRIELPKELTGPRRLDLQGEVLSSRRVTTADGDTFDVSVSFDVMGLSDRVTLRALMAGQPIDFRPIPGTVVKADEDAGAAPRRGRRSRPEGGGNRVARVVIGRDLSTTGMRIERDPDLAPGAPLELALYGGSTTESIVLKGRTEADEHEETWHVRFEGLEESDTRDIEKLQGSADAAGFVIAEILER